MVSTDINCVKQCTYQSNGKCTLSRLPLAAHSANVTNTVYDSECIYCTPTHMQGM